MRSLTDTRAVDAAAAMAGRGDRAAAIGARRGAGAGPSGRAGRRGQAAPPEAGVGAGVREEDVGEHLLRSRAAAMAWLERVGRAGGGTAGEKLE